MAYLIQGLAPEVPENARLVTATSSPGFPCRTTLTDAEVGERLWLFNHVSNDVDGPFRSAFAIYVRETALEAVVYRDALPPVFATRTISLRGFDEDGDLRTVELVAGESIDPAIRAMLDRSDVAYINAHNAAAGCFAAKIVRD